jgi:hypothetical protein
MYYKVVSENSMFRRGNINRAELPYYSSSIARSTYVIGIPTRPDYGKLFIFDTLDNARFHCGPNQTIFVCDAKNVTQCRVSHIPNLYRASEDEIKLFWDYSYEYISGWETPKGTMFADEVTLLYEVA